MNRKRILSAALASALLFAPFLGQTSSVLVNSFYANQTNAERADITNWVANDMEQISSNISSQHIDVNNLDQSKYIIQWGNTLSGISAATGISVRKLAYDNNIKNVDLIYAGDTLILNRDGYVPADWYYQGDGTWVANTKVTINNFIDNSDNTVNINVSPVTVNDSSTNKSTNVYASPADSNANSGSTTAAADEDTASTKAAAASPKHEAADSDTDTTNASSDDTSSTTSAILDDDEFADAISDKLADKLGLEDESALSVDFTEQDEDTTTDSESSDTEDESAESVDDESSDEANEDSETETLYDEDQPIVTSNTKQTTKNANKLAKKIYRQLKEDNKLSDITDADDIEVIVIATAGGFDFNVALPTDDDRSDYSDSIANTDESGDDSDSETEDNDDTEFEEDSSDESDAEASNTAVTTSSNEDTSTDVDEQCKYSG